MDYGLVAIVVVSVVTGIGVGVAAFLYAERSAGPMF